MWGSNRYYNYFNITWKWWSEKREMWMRKNQKPIKAHRHRNPQLVMWLFSLGNLNASTDFREFYYHQWSISGDGSFDGRFLALLLLIFTLPMVITGHDDATGSSEYDYIRRHHKHEVRDNQCTSSLVKHIKAPVHLVRSQIYFIYNDFYPLYTLI